jgi:hypothetical protein
MRSVIVSSMVGRSSSSEESSESEGELDLILENGGNQA